MPKIPARVGGGGDALASASSSITSRLPHSAERGRGRIGLTSALVDGKVNGCLNRYNTYIHISMVCYDIVWGVGMNRHSNRHTSDFSEVQVAFKILMTH